MDGVTIHVGSPLLGSRSPTSSRSASTCSSEPAGQADDRDAKCGHIIRTRHDDEPPAAARPSRGERAERQPRRMSSSRIPPMRGHGNGGRVRSGPHVTLQLFASRADRACRSLGSERCGRRRLKRCDLGHIGADPTRGAGHGPNDDRDDHIDSTSRNDDTHTVDRTGGRRCLHPGRRGRIHPRAHAESRRHRLGRERVGRKPPRRVRRQRAAQPRASRLRTSGCGCRPGVDLGQDLSHLGGATYLALAVYGMVIDRASAANFVPLNTADNWLHIGLGAGMVGLGLITSKSVGPDARAAH